MQWLMDLLCSWFGLFCEESPSGDGRKCLAMATVNYDDLANLGVDCWYVWGWSLWNKIGNIPMSRNGDVPDIPSPEYMLFLNEPENREPYGCDMTPSEAIPKFRAIEAAYPDTIFIVGNSQAVWWLQEFVELYGGWNFPHILGVHVYQSDASTGKDVIDNFTSQLSGHTLWLTEAGLLKRRASVYQFEDFFEYALGKFDRVFCYTNRQDGSGSSLVYDMDLCDDNGLTAIGQAYKEM